MTLKECYSQMRDMWQWLADNPGKGKKDYFIEHYLPQNIISLCYACEYASVLHLRQLVVVCRNCPCLELWPRKCYLSPSPFQIWDKNGASKEQKRVAAQEIADFCKQKEKEC
jgi:hypothetical protein